MQNFPGGAVITNLSAKANYMGSISGQGRSHELQSNKVPVPKLLSSRAFILVCNKRSHCSEKPHAAHWQQLGKACAQQ